MLDRTTTPARRSPAAVSPETRVRTVGRWMVTFAGFPLGGVAAHAVVGPVDRPAAAIAGGLLGGAILGAVQAWGLGPARPRPARWIAATGLGFMTGLTVGAAAVGYRTTMGSLAAMGAICGLTVGLAQAVVLRDQLGARAVGWPPALAALWALGWTITTAVGVEVDERWTVFGSAGAVTVTALTSALPLALNHTARTSPVATTTPRSAS